MLPTGVVSKRSINVFHLTFSLPVMVVKAKGAPLVFVVVIVQDPLVSIRIFNQILFSASIRLSSRGSSPCNLPRIKITPLFKISSRSSAPCSLTMFKMIPTSRISCRGPTSILPAQFRSFVSAWPPSTTITTTGLTRHCKRSLLMKLHTKTSEDMFYQIFSKTSVQTCGRIYRHSKEERESTTLNILIEIAH